MLIKGNERMELKTAYGFVSRYLGELRVSMGVKTRKINK